MTQLSFLFALALACTGCLSGQPAVSPSDAISAAKSACDLVQSAADITPAAIKQAQESCTLAMLQDVYPLPAEVERACREVLKL